jgi:membrane protease YdiL (CAAX protease family)
MLEKINKIIKNPLVILTFSICLVRLSNIPIIFLLNNEIITREGVLFPVIAALSVLIILFVLPAFIITRIFHEKLSDYGLLIPEKIQEAIKISGWVIVVFLPIIFIISVRSDFGEYYAIERSSIVLFVLMTIITAFYYFAEEFLFRGLMFFSLWKKWGIHSFWITNIVFSIFHIGKPVPEVFLAFFLGIVLSYVSLKTKSFIPAVAIHFILALILNILVTYVYPPTHLGVFHF